MWVYPHFRTWQLLLRRQGRELLPLISYKATSLQKTHSSISKQQAQNLLKHFYPWDMMLHHTSHSQTRQLIICPAWCLTLKSNLSHPTEVWLSIGLKGLKSTDIRGEGYWTRSYSKHLVSNLLRSTTKKIAFLAETDVSAIPVLSYLYSLGKKCSELNKSTFFSPSWTLSKTAVNQ